MFCHPAASQSKEPHENKSVTKYASRDTALWPDGLTCFPNGRLCANHVDSIIVYEAKTERSFKAPTVVHALTALPDEFLASAHKQTNTIHLWDVTQTKILSTINVASPPECLTANSNYLISGHSTNSNDGLLFFWKLNRGKGSATTQESKISIKPMPTSETGVEYPVFALCTFPDEHRIASGHADGTIILWDIKEIDNPIKLKTFQNVTGNQINSLAPIIADQEYLATSDLSGNIVLLNLTDGKTHAIGEHAALYTYITLLPTQQLGFISKDEIGTYDLTVMTDYLKTRKILEKDIFPDYFAPGVDQIVLDYYGPNFFAAKKILTRARSNCTTEAPTTHFCKSI